MKRERQESGRPPGPRIGSLRWWFLNRETGAFTVVQFPNWPLFALAVAYLVRLVATEGSGLYAATLWVVALLWIYWGGDELIRGVNPWRRVLGSVVVLWQLVAFVRWV